MQLDPLSVPLRVLRDGVAVNVGQRLARWCPEPEKWSEVEGLWLKKHDHDASARLQPKASVYVEAGDCGAAKRRFQLKMADDRVTLQHEIVTAIVDLWLEYLEPLNAGEPWMTRWTLSGHG